MTSAKSASASLALCLSGGGLRATLFHLGVIRALRACERDGERAIDLIDEIYSVSGGSILAAHMLLNWDRYVGDDDTFGDVEQEILTFAERNVRDRVLRRAALTAVPLFLWRTLTRRPFSGRTFWLRQEYRALLGDATVADSIRPSGAGPILHILTTSFRTGELCSFSGRQFEIERADKGVLGTPCSHIPLTFAVAASSAFPPMFPPLVVTDDLLANPFNDRFLNPILLSDGGVFDNLGLEKFRRNLESRQKVTPLLPRPGTLIISNAGASFRASATKSYSGPLSRNVRASDILMHRVGDHTEDVIDRMTDVDDTVIRLSSTVADGTVDDTVQQRLRIVRTDLDRFRPELARLLIDHGERVTRNALRSKWDVAAQAPSPVPPDLSALHKVAGRGANRTFWSLAFDFRDWRPLLLLWLMGLALIAGAIYLAENYRQAEGKKRVAQTATVELNRTQADTLARAQAALRMDDIARAKQILFGALIDAQEREDNPQTLQSPSTAMPSPQPAPQATSVPGTISGRTEYKQRVYIQFAGSYTREQITALNSRLRNSGWNTQSTSGERTGAARTFNEVRYVPANEPAARALADALNSSGLLDQRVGLRSNDRIGSNLEVWISN